MCVYNSAIYCVPYRDTKLRLKKKKKRLGGKNDLPEYFLERDVWGGVPPLGGEPTVNTTRAGLPEPTTMVPPAAGTVGQRNNHSITLHLPPWLTCLQSWFSPI